MGGGKSGGSAGGRFQKNPLESGIVRWRRQGRTRQRIGGKEQEGREGDIRGQRTDNPDQKYSNITWPQNKGGKVKVL